MNVLGHYVETFLDTSWRWGWQCFTCEAEQTGFTSLDAAEREGDQHQAQTVEPQR